MVAHLLIGKSAGVFGIKMMMQLVCGCCTRKHLLKAKNGCKDQRFHSFDDNGNLGGTVDPIPRIRVLTESSRSIKASLLWDRASNTGLLSSIELHAFDRVRRRFAFGVADASAERNTGSHNLVDEKRAGGEFFDSWKTCLDERHVYIAEDGADDPSSILNSGFVADKKMQPQVPGTDITRTITEAGFSIRQGATIHGLQKALGRFGNRHGAKFRLFWFSMSPDEQQEFAFTTSKACFDARLDQYNRRNELSFLPEVAGVAGICDFAPDKQFDLLQLFRDRAVGGENTWIAEDVALVAELIGKNRLPKLQYHDEDGRYLCDYMGLEDPSDGPFVVLVGKREAKYNAEGTKYENALLDPEEVVKLRGYRSLTDPFKEHVTVLSAFGDGDGDGRNLLNNLLDSNVATCAVCYIYAAMRQQMLLLYLQHVAYRFCILAGENDTESWTPFETAGCYVCSSRTQADGGKLFSCSKCRRVNYCSKECQLRDWKRHKEESCAPSPHSHGVQPVAPSQSQKQNKKKGKGKKNRKK